MPGKSTLTADAAEQATLRALSKSEQRGEADRARAILLTLEGRHAGEIAAVLGVHVWTTASVQGKTGGAATWSGAVMCSASKGAVRMTAGHDEFRGSGPNHLAAQFVPWPSRVSPIPA